MVANVPVISAIICTYNRIEILQEAVDSLIAQDLQSSSYEILIIDNSSTDGTAEYVGQVVKDHTNVRYAYESKPGLSFARNKGWQIAHAKIVAFMDDDAVADSCWLSNILSAFRNVKPQPVVVGGEIQPWYLVSAPDWFDDSLEIRSWGDRARFLDLNRERYGFSGSNMAFRKEVLEEYGGFSAEYGMVGRSLKFGEESELFMRMSQAGELLYYDPGIVVRHAVFEKNYSLKYIWARAYRSGISHFHMDAEAHESVSLIRTSFRLLASVAHLPWYLLSSASLRLAIARKIKRIGHLSGYFAGTLMSVHSRDDGV